MVIMIEESKIRHLEMIQRIIDRMANCSFMLKGWSITLVLGVFTLLGVENFKTCFYIVYVPVLAFWYLDAYFLRQERLYRKLYEKIRLEDSPVSDFSLEISQEEESDERCKFIRCFFSETLFFYYGPLLLICISIIKFVI
jgi:hypothetical protein